MRFYSRQAAHTALILSVDLRARGITKFTMCPHTGHITFRKLGAWFLAHETGVDILPEILAVREKVEDHMDMGSNAEQFASSAMPWNEPNHQHDAAKRGWRRVDGELIDVVDVEGYDQYGDAHHYTAQARAQKALDAQVRKLAQVRSDPRNRVVSNQLRRIRAGL